MTWVIIIAVALVAGVVGAFICLAILSIRGGWKSTPKQDRVGDTFVPTHTTKKPYRDMHDGGTGGT